jgi:hypothetical protein
VSIGLSEIRVYSAATGKLLRVLLRKTGLKPVYRNVVWANASGNVLIVNVSNRDRKDGFGVLSGDHVTPLRSTRGLETYPAF